jgi:predicted HNH restriction endonuclease
MSKSTRQRIPLGIIPKAYEISKKWHDGKISLNDATTTLAAAGPMKPNSARDYLYNYRYLKEGKRFSRTMNAASMEYYFKQFLSEGDASSLRLPVIALAKHIDYYEAKQKTTMRSMRKILESYQQSAPDLIDNLVALVKNIRQLEAYLIYGEPHQREWAANLIRKGICFVAYKSDEETRFVPSKFVGYVDMSMEDYIPGNLDGRDTTPVISRLLGYNPNPSHELEKLFRQYCQAIGVEWMKKGTANATRKYWDISKENGSLLSLPQEGSYEEGGIAMRMHLARERDPRVIHEAKAKFKTIHGCLYCEACEFNYQDKYGALGEDFIEGHHTIPVSNMQPGYKTQAKDIVMVCANCHRMIHRKKPWLTLAEIRGQIVK